MPRYTVTPSDLAAHHFTVRLELPAPGPDGLTLSLPVWIPGSYLVREFARNILSIAAADDAGPVSLRRVDKATWWAPPGTGTLVVTTLVYAWDLSVRAAHLDDTHGYFNGTSLFLRAQGHEGAPHEVRLLPPPSPSGAAWQVATTLPRVSGGPLEFGAFAAADYDELIDHPVEMGTFRHFAFTAEGVAHEVALTGVLRSGLDEARLAADMAAICAAQLRFFGAPAPMPRYLFQVMVVGEGYGGLEHRASTSLLCSRQSLPCVGDDPASEDYANLLGLVSHEYFHTWNVKRIKPAAFTPYDLTRENHTTLLWFFEGVTSYYDDLFVLRAGVWSAARYLRRLAEAFTGVWRTPGRLRQTVADASFDAWTKYYRQDENAPNAQISYYTKGSLIGLALDLTLRRESGGSLSLDAVMAHLWAENGQTGVGVAEDGIEVAVAALLGRPLTAFFDAAVRGTGDLDFASLLADFGVEWVQRPADGVADKGGKAPGVSVERLRARGWLGAKVTAGGGGARLASVLEGSPAHAAGLSAGDVVIAADGLRVEGAELIARLGALPPGQAVELVAFRRDELRRATVVLGAPPEDTIELRLDPEPSPAARARREAWLGA